MAKAFRPKKPLRRIKGPDNGVSKTFSTVGEQQYNTIGKFWDEMSAIYGLENLRGMGYNWNDDSIEYVIGLKNNEIFDVSDTGVLLLFQMFCNPGFLCSKEITNGGFCSADWSFYENTTVWCD